MTDERFPDCSPIAAAQTPLKPNHIGLSVHWEEEAIQPVEINVREVDRSRMICSISMKSVFLQGHDLRFAFEAPDRIIFTRRPVRRTI